MGEVGRRAGGLLIGLIGWAEACTPEPTTSEPWESPVETGATWSSGETDIEALDPSTLPTGADPCREPLLAEVVDIADGDTVWIAPIGPGADELVRLIGFDTPEIDWSGGGASECWAEEARSYTTATLSGEIVWLTFDADCIDPYDRTLAYLHLGAEPDDFFNARMVEDGWGQVLVIPPNDTFADDLYALEQDARGRGVGVWACP
jgi:endonuclease YncB( thermonuclease family)